MGHDIMAQNKAGKTIASLRYTMSDQNSYEVYHLLDALDCHGGVSGLGRCLDFTEQQIEKALKNYNKDQICYPGHKEFESIQQNELLLFLKHCFEISKKEKSVQVCFG